MAYDGTKPAVTSYIADAPAELQENFRALKDDAIVNAGKLSGLEAGHAEGNIPISDGEVNDGLNADRLDGYDASAFAAADHTHSNATASASGLMSSADKAKLDGVEAGATNYAHPTYPAQSNGLYKVTVDGTGHVSETAAVTKADITALGIPGTDTNTESVKYFV